MKNKTFSVIFAIFLLVSFLLFSREVKHGILRQTDFNFTVILQNHMPSQFDQLWDDGAILIDPLVSSAIVIVLSAWVFIRPPKKVRRWQALVIPIGFFILTMTELFGKTTLPHPGPPFFMVKHPTTIFPKFTMMEPFSYPSGHASRVTFLAVTLAAVLWLKLKTQRAKVGATVIIGFYVFFICLGRIYLGQHWLSDVIGGTLLGTALGLLTVTGFTL